MNILYLIGWLYLIQGIPYGIQDKFIPLYVHLQTKSYSSVSLMKALLFPWVCKGVWAPFLQVYFGPFFWLVISVAGLSVTSLFASTLTTADLYGTAAVLFLLNIFSAIQDIVVDGFALNALKQNELGLGNSLQIVLYKIGSLVGGAGLLYISSYSSWSTAFIFLSLLYFLSVIVVGFHSSTFLKVWKGSLHSASVASDTSCEEKSKEEIDQVSASESNIKNVFSIFKEVIYTKNLFRLCLYVSIYKMGERGTLNNFPLFLSDKGVTSSQLAFWNGVASQSFSILGSAAGGLQLSNESKKTNRLLKTNIIRRSIAIFLCYFIIEFWRDEAGDLASKYLFYYLSMISLMYLNYTSGVISTATFTLMMEESRKLSKRSQATHYSCLASIEVGGKLIFATMAGFIIDSIDLNRSFLLFFALSLFSHILL